MATKTTTATGQDETLLAAWEQAKAAAATARERSEKTWDRSTAARRAGADGVARSLGGLAQKREQHADKLEDQADDAWERLRKERDVARLRKERDALIKERDRLEEKLAKHPERVSSWPVAEELELERAYRALSERRETLRLTLLRGPRWPW